MNFRWCDGKPVSREEAIAVLRDEGDGGDGNEFLVDNDCSSSSSSDVSTIGHHIRNKRVRGGEGEEEDILHEVFARLPQFEEIHVINSNNSNNSNGKEAVVLADKEDNDDEEEEQGLEFRLFAAASTPSSVQKSATESRGTCNAVDAAPTTSMNTTAATSTIQRIRLNSPIPCHNPGFVVPDRQLKYYLAGTPSAAKMAEYESAAVEGEDVVKKAAAAGTAGTIWYGCAYAWKVIRVVERSGGGALIDRSTKGVEGGSSSGDVVTATDVERANDNSNNDAVGTVVSPDDEEAGKTMKKRKSKPGKKARIRIRILTRAQEQKEMQMREKKMRKNRRKMVKRRAKRGKEII